MDKNISKQLKGCIDFYKQKIEYNGSCKDMYKSTQDYIEKLGGLAIPPQEIIEKKLVNYMKGVALRFPKVKREADVVARKWQQQVDQWLRENNLTEKRYLEQLDRNMRPMQPSSPRWNGTWNAHQRSSGSDDRQNYHSSSSQEVESPDSQRANERSTSMNHRSNHHNSFARKSSSPLQFEHPSLRNLSPTEYNANLSIDPKEVTPINKAQGSPAKPFDRFSICMKEKMFKAVKQKEPIKKEVMSKMSFLCKDLLKLPLDKHPDYIKGFQECPDLDSGDRTKSLKGKTEKNKDSTHITKTPRNSHNMPSTSLQGARESSKNCPESKHDRRRSHMESSQSTVKTKEFKEQNSKNFLSTSQLCAVKSSNSWSVSKHDRNKKHMESSQSVINSKELKLEKPPTQESKNLSSMLQQGGTESSKTCHVSKHDRKRKHIEGSQSVIRTKEFNEEQRHSQDNKLKHMSRTDRLVKESSKESKEELQPPQDRTLKCKGVSQSVAKAYEFKDEYQLTPNNKLKLDAKRVSAMAMESRNCDKNHTKKRDSVDQSAMVAITSSKKDRTSVYHGGRNCKVLRLQDLCIQTLFKVIKQHSDPTKYINKHAEFKILEPILVLIGAEKLHKLEEKMKYLKNDTNAVWQFYCEKDFKSRVHLKRDNENWCTFYQRCFMETDEKLKNVTASISASASKAKPERQIKLTTVDGPPTKRPKSDHAMIAKSNPNNLANRPLPNSCHPSNSRSEVPVPPKGIPNHIKSSHKTIKKDAPLMHKAKKTLGQLHRIHRN